MSPALQLLSPPPPPLSRINISIWATAYLPLPQPNKFLQVNKLVFMLG